MNKEIQSLIDCYDAVLQREKDGMLRSFNELFTVYDQVQQGSSDLVGVEEITKWRQLLDKFLTVKKEYFRRERNELTTLNVFDVLTFARDEVIHSKVIAWLLDPAGSHMHENLFFKIFLGELGISPAYADFEYQVSTEVSGESSRIDIEILSFQAFVIHIENKIGASEGENQLMNEWTDLQRRANAQEIPKSSRHGLFLTPTGHLPSMHAGFKALSWVTILSCVKTFSEEIESQKLIWFLDQYRQTILTHII